MGVASVRGSEQVRYSGAANGRWRVRRASVVASGCGMLMLRASAAASEGVTHQASMEFFLALLVTASQACGSPLLGVSLRFEEDEALDNACAGMEVCGG